MMVFYIVTWRSPDEELLSQQHLAMYLLEWLLLCVQKLTTESLPGDINSLELDSKPSVNLISSPVLLFYQAYRCK